MPTKLAAPRALFVVLAGALVASSAALAETVNFKADAKGAAQVPPVNSKATGTLTATYDTATKKLTWKGEYTGLSGRATAAHFHGPADATKTAGVALNIATFEPKFEGSATLTDAQAADLLAGNWYLNIHTQSHPGGEIRGQVVKAK
jgi:hypothetical protein